MVKAKWPNLRASLSDHVGEGLWFTYASLSEAIDAASKALDHRQRKQVLREWWDWNATVGTARDPRTEIAYLGVEKPFDSAEDARAFMNAFHDKIVIDIRIKEPGWKP